MIELLPVLTYILIFYIFITEISAFMVYGWFADAKTLDIIDSMDSESFCINRFNSKILNPCGGKFYISYIGFPPCIFSFYYISDAERGDLKGRIPIWSKTHRKIRQLYKDCRIREIF